MCDKENKRIQCFNENGEYISCFTTDTKQPESIAMMTDGRLAVCHDTTPNDSSFVTIYTKGGSMVSRIRSGNMVNNCSFRDIKCRKDELYVTMSEIDQVIVVTDMGNTVRTIGNIRDNSWCNGVAVAEDGHVLKTEGLPSSCVSIWSPAGECVHQIPSSVNMRPYHLTFMADGALVVVSGAKEIKIFL